MANRRIERLIVYEGESEDLQKQLENALPDGSVVLPGNVTMTIRTKEGWMWKSLLAIGKNRRKLEVEDKKGEE